MNQDDFQETFSHADHRNSQPELQTEQQTKPDARREIHCATAIVQRLNRMVTQKLSSIRYSLARIASMNGNSCKPTPAQLNHELTHQLWTLQCGVRLDLLTVDQIQEQQRPLQALQQKLLNDEHPGKP